MGEVSEDRGPRSPSTAGCRLGGIPGLSYPLLLGGGSRDARLAGAPRVS